MVTTVLSVIVNGLALVGGLYFMSRMWQRTQDTELFVGGEVLYESAPVDLAFTRRASLSTIQSTNEARPIAMRMAIGRSRVSYWTFSLEHAAELDDYLLLALVEYESVIGSSKKREIGRFERNSRFVDERVSVLINCRLGDVLIRMKHTAPTGVGVNWIPMTVDECVAVRENLCQVISQIDVDPAR